MSPAHETQMSALSKDSIKISFQQWANDNFTNVDHLNADGKEALRAYILKAILDAFTENNISPIPNDVHVIIVKSGFISRALLTL